MAVRIFATDCGWVVGQFSGSWPLERKVGSEQQRAFRVDRVRTGGL